MTPRLETHWLGRVAYRPTLARQDALVAAKIAGPATAPDTLLLLEHEPVYTIGRTPDRSSLPAPAGLPFPVETIQRGGQATYHGPGQLVGYPILDLSTRGRDLHRYLRFLEEVLIDSLALHGIGGARRPGLTGVWIGPRKIASIGVGVRKWITLHGFSINVLGGEALTPYRAITPCGIAGVAMTAVELEGPARVEVASFACTVGARFAALLDQWLPRDPAVARDPVGRGLPGATPPARPDAAR